MNKFEGNYKKVGFDKNTSGFEIWYNITVGAYGEKATHKINFASIIDANILVIGNIHDNLGLLRDSTTNFKEMKK